jgi:hypothetical protein
MSPDEIRRREKAFKRAHERERKTTAAFSKAIAELQAQLPSERPPGENFFLLELTNLDDPVDISWNRAASLLGSWEKITLSLGTAVMQLFPIRGKLR